MESDTPSTNQDIMVHRCYYCKKKFSSSTATVQHCISDHRTNEICLLRPHTDVYDFTFVHIHPETYGGKFKFLTVWNLLLQTFYFGFCVLTDAFSNEIWTKSGNKQSTLQKCRDLLVTTIIWPMGGFVVITFWGLYTLDRELVFPKRLDRVVPIWFNHVELVVTTFWALYAVDRELVFPKALDGVVPVWLNHLLHTTVILFLLVDKLLVYHRHPSQFKGLTITIGFGLIYQIWILWIAYHADIWVYPILQVLDWPRRIMFFAACWVLLFFIYSAGESTTKILWGVQDEEKAKKTA